MPDNTKIEISRRVINKTKVLKGTGRVIKSNKSLFIFFSKGNKTININGNFHSTDNMKILCRQLATAFALRKKLDIKNYHEAFQTPKNIPFLNENHYDQEKIDYTADSYYLINIEKIGESLYTLSQRLKLGESKHMLLFSEVHAMAISLENKRQQGFTAKFYDPNTSIAHKQIWFAEAENIKTLSINDLLSLGKIDEYFINFNGV